MDEHKHIEKREERTDPSKVGVAFIKYAAILIIFFGILWFIINYLF